MKVTPEQFAIMTHTKHRAANGKYCGGSDDMKDLVEQGLMQALGSTGFCPDEYFCLTKAGHEFLKAGAS